MQKENSLLAKLNATVDCALYRTTKNIYFIIQIIESNEWVALPLKQSEPTIYSAIIRQTKDDLTAALP